MAARIKAFFSGRGNLWSHAHQRRKGHSLPLTLTNGGASFFFTERILNFSSLLSHARWSLSSFRFFSDRNWVGKWCQMTLLRRTKYIIRFELYQLYSCTWLWVTLCLLHALLRRKCRDWALTLSEHEHKSCSAYSTERLGPYSMETLSRDLKQDLYRDLIKWDAIQSTRLSQ